MIGYQIPRPDWADFLTRFAVEHRGDLVTVKSVSTRADPGGPSEEILAEGIPLASIDLVRGAEGDEIVFAVGATIPDGDVSVVVRSPERITLAEDEGRPDGHVRVDAAGERSVIVALRRG